MSNTEKLENLVHLYLTHLVKNKSPDFTPELELRFRGSIDGEYSNKPQPISRDDYYNVLQVFKSIDPAISSFASPSGEYLLRIYPYYNGRPSPFRCEITGLRDIQEYCMNNDWKTCPSAKFVKKDSVYDGSRQVDDIYMDTYAIKAAYKREISYVGHQIDLEPQLKDIANNWSKVEKTFRHMNRVSFSIGEGGYIKMDASIVKSSNQDDRGNFIPVREIHQSNVFKNFEKYEIELEVQNENILANKPQFESVVQYTKAISRTIQATIRKVLVGLQKTPFPIPKDEMVNVLEDYIRVIHRIKLNEPVDRKVGKYGLTSPKNFIGPSSVALKFENLYSNEITKMEVPYVKENYCVTDKADGERHLLFVSPRDGRLYLIDMNMRVKYTGIELQDKYNLDKYGGVIIDGEYITKDKNSQPISNFMAFDLYFGGYRKEGGTDFRSFPFHDEDVSRHSGKRELIDGRYTILKKIISGINYAIRDNAEIYRKKKIHIVSTNLCQLGVKTFKFIYRNEDEESNFTSSCKEILRMAETYPYSTDGLIFTPLYHAVGAKYNKPEVQGPPIKIRWDMSFKWKPPQYNTNDFLVTTVKTDTNDDRITDLIEPYTIAGSPIQRVQYKTLELRCGFSYDKSGYLNAFTRILSLQKMEQIREEYRDDKHYMPTLFYPTDYPDRYSHISNVILEPDDSGNMQMITEEGEIVDDNTIVEFRYEKSNQDGFRWVPLRVRSDKTQEYRKGLKSYGNDYETANGNWKSMMNPITENMLTTGEMPPYEEIMITGDAYYTKSSSGNRDVLQKFHNYVKEDLITSTVQKEQTLIDLACGKAGDLWKWDKAKASFVFGVDYSRDNIENRFDGAAARYMNYYKDRMNAPVRGTPTETIRCIFATADSSKNIRNGEGMFNEINKTVSNAVLGIGGGARDSVIGNLYGIGANGFDVCSCQFALHYFFKNVSTLEGFMTNVCQNVKIGGLFIGTCYNGKAVFDAIKASGTDSITINSGLELYWKCEKKYKETTFEDNLSSLGYEIDVFQKSIGLIHTEYLVNFDYLVRVMEQYGFEVVKITPFKEIYEGLDGPNAEKYKELDGLPEKFISFLNNAFVFRKVTDVDPLLVVLDRTPIAEKKAMEEEIAKKAEEEAEIEEPEPEPEPEPVPEPTAPKKVAPKADKTRKVKECKDPMQELVDGRCLKKCEEGSVRNPETKRCNKTKKNK